MALLARHKKILRDYRSEWGRLSAMDYDNLPTTVRAALHKVKNTETLWSDVNRWLDDARTQ